MVAGDSPRGVDHHELTSPKTTSATGTAISFWGCRHSDDLGRRETSSSDHCYDILTTQGDNLLNNIRSNIGYMVNANDDDPYREYNYFHQEGRKVFKEFACCCAYRSERREGGLSGDRYQTVVAAPGQH